MQSRTIDLITDVYVYTPLRVHKIYLSTYRHSMNRYNAYVLCDIRRYLCVLHVYRDNKRLRRKEARTSHDMGEYTFVTASSMVPPSVYHHVSRILGYPSLGEVDITLNGSSR